jgi:hypothetical protein
MTRADWTSGCGIVIAVGLCLGLVLGIITFVESVKKDHKEKIVSGYYLPEGSTDVITMKGGWQEFTYKGQRFLFHQYAGNNNGYECIVKINMPQTPSTSPEAGK